MPKSVLHEDDTWLLMPRSCEIHQSLDCPLRYCTGALETDIQYWNKKGILTFLTQNMFNFSYKIEFSKEQ
jgi:hypothetical protein